MKFTPKTEKEILYEGLIPDKTVCDFEVVAATDAISKASGAEMIALKLKVFHNEGFKLVDDYLVAAMARKVRHFCEMAKLVDVYEGGTLTAEHCKGVCGKVTIAIEDKEDGYPPKNKVGDYYVPKKAAAPAAAAPSTDDVPF